MTLPTWLRAGYRYPTSLPQQYVISPSKIYPGLLSAVSAILRWSFLWRSPFCYATLQSNQPPTPFQMNLLSSTPITFPSFLYAPPSPNSLFLCFTPLQTSCIEKHQTSVMEKLYSSKRLLQEVSAKVCRRKVCFDWCVHQLPITVWFNSLISQIQLALLNHFI